MTDKAKKIPLHHVSGKDIEGEMNKKQLTYE